MLLPSLRTKQAKTFPSKTSTLRVQNISARVCVSVYVFHLHFFSFPFIFFSPSLHKLDWECCNLIRKRCFRWYFF